MITRPSAIALLLANLVPLAGILWLDWRVFDVLMLYWAENVVIGIVNVMRLIAWLPTLGLSRLAHQAHIRQLTEADRTTLSGFRYFVIPFFVVHYGMFCYGHYTAVVSLFGDDIGDSARSGWLFGVPLSDAWQSSLWIGVAAIVVSHLLSFFLNFMSRGEYQRTNFGQLMRRPYGRMMALHISVIAGGFLVVVLGDPVWMLLVLIVVKIVIDLRMHERERNLFGAMRART